MKTKLIEERNARGLAVIEVEGQKYTMNPDIAELVVNALSVMPVGERWVLNGGFPPLGARRLLVDGACYDLVPGPNKFCGDRSTDWKRRTPHMEARHEGGLYELLVLAGETHAVVPHEFGAPWPDGVVAVRFVGLAEGWV